MDSSRPSGCRCPSVDTPSLVTALDRTRRTRALVEELIADPAQLGPDFQPVRRLGRRRASSAGRPPAAAGRAPSWPTRSPCWARPPPSAWSSGWTGRSAAWSSTGRCWPASRETVHLTPEPQTYLSACPPRLAVSVRPRPAGAGGRRRGARRRARRPAAARAGRRRDARLGLADRAGRRRRRAATRCAPSTWSAPTSSRSTCPGPAGRGSAAVARVPRRRRCRLGAEVMALGVDMPVSGPRRSALGATVGRGLLLGTPGPLPL